jgi:hypothetical protein
VKQLRDIERTDRHAAPSLQDPDEPEAVELTEA